MKRNLKIVFISVLAVVLLILMVNRAIEVSKQDVKFIKHITNVESMEKAGHAAGGVKDELKIRKDAFMKGYKDTVK